MSQVFFPAEYAYFFTSFLIKCWTSSDAYFLSTFIIADFDNHIEYKYANKLKFLITKQFPGFLKSWEATDNINDNKIKYFQKEFVDKKIKGEIEPQSTNLLGCGIPSGQHLQIGSVQVFAGGRQGAASVPRRENNHHKAGGQVRFPR